MSPTSDLSEGLRNHVLRHLFRVCLPQLTDRILMAAPWAGDILVSTTSTLTALAVISFDKMTDRKFNAVGGKEEKHYDAVQVGE